jgi:HEPN domain-containing protein
MKETTKQWVLRAEEDFLVAQREHEAKPPARNAVCFHCQQCVEKYFKAVLQERDVFFEKTHDLDVLLEKAAAFLPQLVPLKRGIVEVSSFAVEARYPGLQCHAQDARTALRIARSVRAVVRHSLALKR